MTDWYKNDELFRKEVSKGHAYERYVADYLSDEGLDASITEQTVRDHVRDASQYEKELDIIVEGRPCEVKSRDLWFTGPHNFPYDTIFVDTVSGWNAKDPEPVAVLCVSQKSKAIIVLPISSTREQWTSTKRWDHVRKINDLFYEAPADFWAPVGAFVRRMKQLKNSK